MDRLVIQGGHKLNGHIPISGAKNSALKLMVACLLTDQPITLTNMPSLADTRFLAQQELQLVRPVIEIDAPDGVHVRPLEEALDIDGLIALARENVI